MDHNMSRERVVGNLEIGQGCIAAQGLIDQGLGDLNRDSWNKVLSDIVEINGRTAPSPQSFGQLEIVQYTDARDRSIGIGIMRKADSHTIANVLMATNFDQAGKSVGSHCSNLSGDIVIE